MRRFSRYGLWGWLAGVVAIMPGVIAQASRSRVDGLRGGISTGISTGGAWSAGTALHNRIKNTAAVKLQRPLNYMATSCPIPECPE